MGFLFLDILDMSTGEKLVVLLINIYTIPVQCVMCNKEKMAVWYSSYVYILCLLIVWIMKKEKL